MTLWQFIDKWIGKKLDWDNAWAGQCVDLFRYYCDEVLEIDQPAGVWGAANFWSDFESDPVLVANFTKVENNADFTPLEGDVMVWNFNAGGGFGHIAMCTGENTGTQYFKSFDQNWSRVSYCEIVNHSYKNVYGVLRPKEKNMTDLEVCLEQHEQLVNEAGEKNKEIDKLKKENTDLQKQVSEYENTINDLENTVQDLGWKLQDCEEGSPGVPCMEEIDGFKKTSIEITTFQDDKEIKTTYKKRLI